MLELKVHDELLQEKSKKVATCPTIQQRVKKVRKNIQSGITAYSVDLQQYDYYDHRSGERRVMVLCWLNGL